MRTSRVDEFHRYGCDFYGKLVVVDYSRDMADDPDYLKFGATGVLNKYKTTAKKLIEEKGYKVKRVLFQVPVYVVEIQ